MDYNINFPGFGIYLKHVGKYISVFGFDIAFYGIIISISIIFGIILATIKSKKTNQNPDDYINIAILGSFFGIIGARIYYVIFNFKLYKDNLISVFNLREGGLAIYGGIIFAVISTYIYCRIKKLDFMLVLDTASPCIILGQIIGRWGNFFNREAFGEYTKNIFRMEIPINAVANESDITPLMNNNIITRDGIDFITVSPTFLYESMWNILVLLFLLFYIKHKRFNGEIFLFYLIGYSLGRIMIESLRTDSLYLPGTTLKASQILSIIIAITSILFIRLKKKKQIQEKN